MKIIEITNYPCLFEDAKTGSTHESVLRSYQALNKILQMIERGDSKETIIEVANMMGYFEKP